MIKRFISILLVLFIFINTTQFSQAMDITSEAILLYDLENECILYEKNSEEIRSVASLTKLMAIIVAIEEIDNLHEEIEVDGEIIQGYYDYSKVGLDHGDVVTYEDLLYGMMLPSGADAALLITYHVAGSEEAFARLMNQKATELNMTNSHFDNAVGRDSENNYSTAKDLVKLLKYALKNETFHQMFTAKEYKINHLNIEMKNTLDYYTKNTDYDTSVIIGSKTGYTDEAGYCLASLAYHDTQPVVLITLGADTDYRVSAINDSLKIYEDFMSSYVYTEVLNQSQAIVELPVKLGWKKTYTVLMPENIYGFVEDKESLDIQYHGVEELNKDIKKGDYIGRVEVYQNNYLLASYDLHLQDRVYYHYPLIYAAVILCLIGYFNYKKSKLRKRRRRRRRR